MRAPLRVLALAALIAPQAAFALDPAKVPAITLGTGSTGDASMVGVTANGATQTLGGVYGTVQGNASAIAGEVSRAKAAEALLAPLTAVQANASAITGEISRATGVEALLAPKLNPTFSGSATIPTLVLSGSGSTGDVSGMTVTFGGTTRTLAAWLPAIQGSTNPVFTGTVTAPSLSLTGSGSSGDVSGMSATPSSGAASGTLARLLSDQASAIASNTFGIAGKAPLVSPTFSGAVTAPSLILSGAGSTGDVSGMSVATGGLSRPLSGIVGDRMSVANYTGADPSGNTDSTAAFQAAYNAAAAYQEILIPPGVYKVGTITGSKSVRWNASGASAFPGAALFNLPGVVTYGFGSPQLTVQSQTTASDLAAVSVRRNTSHTGGTPGNVSSAFRIDHTVGSSSNTGATNFEWALTSVMNNWASAGENVGGYLQCNNYGTGPCWGGLMEFIDKTGLPNPTKGQVVAELDHNAYGSDNNGQRILTDYVLRRPVGQESAGARNEATAGIRFSGEFGFALPNSRYYNLITTQTALEVGNGLNLSNASITGNAILLGAGQKIAMETTGQNNIYFNTTNAATQFTGSLAVGNAMYISPTTPASSSSACITGRIAFDQNYVYACVATNTWRRSALSAF